MSLTAKQVEVLTWIRDGAKSVPHEWMASNGALTEMQGIICSTERKGLWTRDADFNRILTDSGRSALAEHDRAKEGK